MDSHNYDKKSKFTYIVIINMKSHSYGINVQIITTFLNYEQKKLLIMK